MPLSPFSRKIFFTVFVFSAFLLKNVAVYGAGEKQTETFDSKEVTFHHVLDQYEWEFFKMPDGTPVKILLPRIIYDKHAHKLVFFKSTEDALEVGFCEAKEYNPDAKHGDLLLPGAKERLDGLEKELAKTTDPTVYKNLKSGIDDVYGEYNPIDFSITKNVIFMFIAAALLLIVFLSVAKSYKKNKGEAPKGLQAMMEPIVVYIRDEVGKENIPNMYERFMPLLLTMFFFILFLNLLGLVPFSSNVSGNISFTLTLALVTLIVTNVKANKAYWRHIFWPPVPHFMKVIMIPLEIVSIFTKPFALTIRLFANITGGHIVVISLLSLIFIFGKMGEAVTAGFSVGILSTIFVIAIGCLEIFVALLQAFVFTLLTAVFIGQAVAEDEHH